MSDRFRSRDERERESRPDFRYELTPESPPLHGPDLGPKAGTVLYADGAVLEEDMIDQRVGRGEQPRVCMHCELGLGDRPTAIVRPEAV